MYISCYSCETRLHGGAYLGGHCIDTYSINAYINAYIYIYITYIGIHVYIHIYTYIYIYIYIYKIKAVSSV